MKVDNNIAYEKITIGEFLKAKPSKYQASNGEVKLNKTRLGSLAKVANHKDLLSGMYGGVIQITEDNRLTTGHHRQADIARRVEEETCSLDETFVIQRLSNLSAKEEAKIVYLSNHGHNRTNKNAQIIFGSPLSERVFKPIYNAIVKTGFDKTIPEGSLLTLVKNLGSFLNRNPVVAANLVSGRAVEISGHNIYTGKANKEAKDEVFDCSPQIDLRGYETLLATRLKPSFEVLYQVTTSKKWELAFEGKRQQPMPLVYTLTAAGLQGKVAVTAKQVGIITGNRIMKLLNTPKSVKRLQDKLTQYVNGAEAVSGALFSLLGGD